MSPALRPETRLAILERDDYTCRYCGAQPDQLYDWHPFIKRWIALIHVDHVIPRSQGGTDDPSNLVTACRRCNLAKYDAHWTPLGWEHWTPLPEDAQFEELEEEEEQ